MLDTRNIIFTAWLTFFVGTLSNTFTYNYFANQNAIPDSLGDTTFIWLGVWLGGFLGALTGGWLGWGRAWAGSVAGFGLAALLRLIFLGVFLPTERSNWDFFAGLLTFDLAPYPVFVLLVLGGGALATLCGALLATLLRPAKREAVPIHPRFWAGAVGLMLVSMLLLILPNALSEALDATPTARADIPIVVPNTNWLMLPHFNMIVAALYGGLMGLAARSMPSRAAAALTLWLAGCAHVMLLLPLEEILVGYDPLYDGINPNQVAVLTFIALWVGTPLVGALAAFALYNLREAFTMPPTTEPTP